MTPSARSGAGMALASAAKDHSWVPSRLLSAYSVDWTA
jgi:hypothetical protein